jgi:hypothetical protein
MGQTLEIWRMLRQCSELVRPGELNDLEASGRPFVVRLQLPEQFLYDLVVYFKHLSYLLNLETFIAGYEQQRLNN